jgi:DNA (cytosine-5)-methyltransferase 1
VKTFAHNHPATRVKQADLRAITLADLDQLHGGEFRPLGVIGGPPCQSFSVANVHQTEHDPRHDLPDTYARLLTDLHARHPLAFFLFENVPGLLGQKHRHRYTRLLERFAAAGFDVHAQVLDAQAYGVPQRRPRVFVLGINRALHPADVWRWPAAEATRVTVADAIHGLPPPVYYRRDLTPAAIPYHPNHWCPRPLSAKFRSGQLQTTPVQGRSFRRLSWDEPSWTVAYGHREIHIHPDGTRRLSIHEAMRLQTFPFAYQLLGNMSAQARLVSEAVPIQLAWRLAQTIGQTLGIVPQSSYTERVQTNSGEKIMFHRATFVIDSIPDHQFQGFSDDDTWNGWACPYFEKAEAERILRASEANGFQWRFLPTRNAFEVILTRQGSDQAPEFFAGVVIDIHGQPRTVYPIGAYSWIWETLEAVE